MDSREAIDLQNQILSLRRDLQLLREQGGGGGAAPPPAASGAPLSGDLSAQLLDRVTQLEDQVRQLRGRIDESDNAARRQNEDLSKRIGDLEFRAGAGGGPAAAPTPGRPMPVTPPAGVLTAPPGTVPVPAAPPPAGAAIRRTPEMALQEGNAALARHDYAAAEASAREILATGKGPRTTDAQYLLAQSLAGRRDYQGAAVAFDDAYSRNPKGSRAPDSLLGLANSLTAINERKGSLREPGQAARRIPGAAPRPAPDRRGGSPAGRLLTADREGPLGPAEFAARLDRLGPFEPNPRLAVAVSGGADSLALAWLAARWAADRGGTILAIVVDHGLRPDSAAEAALTRSRLRANGIASDGLTLALQPGSRLAERARQARHAALEAACAKAGLLHLLFGHHAADQAETVAMRRLRRSGPAGLAGMAALRETNQVRLLRPLLDVPPVRLRQTLGAAGLSWIEDPSNRDPASERARLRAFGRDRDGAGPLVRAAVEAATSRGRARAEAERACAAWLGRHVAIFPTGHALVRGDPIPPDALAALIATLGGRTRPPPAHQVAAWLARPRPATLGGVQFPAGGRVVAAGTGGRCDRPYPGDRPGSAVGWAISSGPRPGVPRPGGFGGRVARPAFRGGTDSARVASGAWVGNSMDAICAKHCVDASIVRDVRVGDAETVSPPYLGRVKKQQGLAAALSRRGSEQMYRPPVGQG